MPANSRSLPASCRILASLGVLALLQACASQPQISASGEAHRYRQHARRTYTPPGPPSDPWGPYIQEASAKFDMPEGWIRAVMRQESGGNLFLHGDLITSGAGAMGLMQVMPDTYDELRSRYPDLGDDPFDPHDNIMAGSAYLREMYDIYGSPGFLAAYNAGPGRLDDYLTRNRPLPAETRRYVAAISPRLGDGAPHRGSPGAQYAMNRIPGAIPAGPRYADPNAAFVPPPGYTPPARAGVQYAMNDAPAVSPARASYQDPDAAFVPPPGYTPPAHAEPVAATGEATSVEPPPATLAVSAEPLPPAESRPAAPLPEPTPAPVAAPVPPLPVARPTYTPPPRALVQVAELPDETLAETPRRAEVQQAPLPEPPPEPQRALPVVREAPPAAPTRLASRESRPSLPVPPALPSHMPFQMAADSQRPAPGSHGFHLIAPAMAEPVAIHHGGPTTGNWAIQVGAFASSNLAAAATAAAREEARADLAHARGSVSQVHQGRTTLYRARLQGLSHDGAAQACERLVRQRTNCMVVSPDAQS